MLHKLSSIEESGFERLCVLQSFDRVWILSAEKRHMRREGK